MYILASKIIAECLLVIDHPEQAVYLLQQEGNVD